MKTILTTTLFAAAIYAVTAFFTTPSDTDRALASYLAEGDQSIGKRAGLVDVDHYGEETELLCPPAYWTEARGRSNAR